MEASCTATAEPKFGFDAAVHCAAYMAPDPTAMECKSGLDMVTWSLEAGQRRRSGNDGGALARVFATELLHGGWRFQWAEMVRQHQLATSTAAVDITGGGSGSHCVK